jgi:MFS transporter, DHA2 family, multidrug resistance protein
LRAKNETLIGLIFPIVPRLMKAFDLRLIVFVGALIFGGSCLLNIYMNPEFGGPQFQIGNISYTGETNH